MPRKSMYLDLEPVAEHILPSLRKVLEERELEVLLTAFATRMGETLYWPRELYLKAQMAVEEALGAYIQAQGVNNASPHFTYATPHIMTPIRELNQVEAFDTHYSRAGKDAKGPMATRVEVIHANLVERGLPTTLLVHEPTMEKFVETGRESNYPPAEPVALVGSP